MRQSLKSRLAAAMVLAAAATAVLSGCGSSSAGNASGGAGANGTSAANTAAEQNPNLDLGSSVGGPAPDFTLTNQFGQQMSLSQFKGKVTVLSFEDPECTDICPLTSESMLLAKEYLGKAGEDVQLLGVSANPGANKVSDVMAYTKAHGLVNQWDMLTGSDSELQSVWKKYNIAVQVADGDIDHTPAVYVIDQQGRLRKLYLTQMAYDSVGQAAQVMAQEISSLLPGHPKLLSQQSLATVTPYPPSQPVTLPSATGPGTVALGGKKARVVVFFTTWLDYVSNLKGELTTLNSYAKAAPADHLPPLTAVDETTTEPSDQAVTSYLKSVGTLDYPVALDKTGRVADGFQAEDQPWLAVVSPAGKITWQHDGWVSLSALEAAAKKAG